MIFSVTDGGILMSSVPVAQESQRLTATASSPEDQNGWPGLTMEGARQRCVGRPQVASGYPGQRVARSRSPAKTTSARLDWQRRHPDGTPRSWPCSGDRIGCPGDPRQRDEPAMTKGRTWFFLAGLALGVAGGVAGRSLLGS